MTKRKRKPHDPAVQARLDAKAADRKADLERLSLQPDVSVTLDAAGRLAGAKRQDVFDELLSRHAIDQGEHNAIRRMEKDLAVSKGVGDPAISSGQGGPRGPLDVPVYLLLRIDASDRLRAVMTVMGMRDFGLLHSLLTPSLEGRIEPWRPAVFMLTGEHNDRAQTAIVRQALKALVQAFVDVDNGIERRRAA